VAKAELIPQWAFGFTDWLDAGVLRNKVSRARDDIANGTQVVKTGAKLFLELQIQSSSPALSPTCVSEIG
jgi:hypothetical protein